MLLVIALIWLNHTKIFFEALHQTHESRLRKWKAGSSTAKPKLYEWWRRRRRPSRYLGCAISTMAQSTAVINVAEVAREDWWPAFFTPPKQQSSRNTMYPPSTNLFTSMGSVCWWQRKNPWAVHLSTANNSTSSPVISVSHRIWLWRWKWWKCGHFISRGSCKNF